MASSAHDWAALVPNELANAAHLREGLSRLHATFAQAPLLGSLLDPSKANKGDLFAADYALLGDLLQQALTAESQASLFDAVEIEDHWEMALSAQGLMQAARLLEQRYHLVITNVPYLARGKQERAGKYSQVTGAEALKELDSIGDELQRLSVLHERATSTLTLQSASLREYEELLVEAKEDLERNKTAAKLRDLGAKHAVELATGHCPTCHQLVEDSLLSESLSGPQMDLDTNIAYLESQCRMLVKQISGLRDGVRVSEATVGDIAFRLAAKHDQRNSLRGDVSSGANESRSMVRRQVQIEVEVEDLQQLEVRVGVAVERLAAVARRLADNQVARKGLPRDNYTTEDQSRISLFEKLFRANAGSFGYESAPIAEIQINRDSLVPSLSQIELREIIKKTGPRTDIKADSSASDFVRLIWSYLLALQQTSVHPTTLGNHPGILLFDEPGQHSMAVDSQHSLLQQLAGQPKLQSIVAASFDESETVFQQATLGVTFQLIDWRGKLLQPL